MEYLLMQEKKAMKEEKLKQEEKYMWAVVDGVKEKVISSFDYLSFYSSSLPICNISSNI